MTAISGAAKNTKTSSKSSIQEVINNKLLQMISTDAFIQEKIQTRVKNTVEIICKRCHSDNVYVESRQVRSADEAMTKFYECLHCGNRWRVD